MENNLVPVGRNDDTSQRASPIHPAPPSQLFINDTTDDTNTAVIQADLEAFHKHRTSIALFLLLLFHFILAYVATFASLLFVILLEHRLRSLFDEQISLKSSTNRNTLWTIFATSACFLTLVHLFAPIALDITVVDRLTFTPFHSQMDDFISLFMLCYFTDSTLRILVCAIKIAIYFLLNPRSSAAESHGPIFPNFSCLRGNNSSAFSSFPAGIRHSSSPTRFTLFICNRFITCKFCPTCDVLQLNCSCDNTLLVPVYTKLQQMTLKWSMSLVQDFWKYLLCMCQLFAEHLPPVERCPREMRSSPHWPQKSLTWRAEHSLIPRGGEGEKSTPEKGRAVLLRVMGRGIELCLCLP